MNQKDLDRNPYPYRVNSNQIARVRTVIIAELDAMDTEAPCYRECYDLVTALVKPAPIQVDPIVYTRAEIDALIIDDPNNPYRSPGAWLMDQAREWWQRELDSKVPRDMQTRISKGSM